MKKLVILLPLLLAACLNAKPQLISKQSVVFIPDSKFFYCPTVSTFPDVSKLTDQQVAKLLITLDTYNHDCKTSINAIRAQLNAARNKLGAN